MNQKNKLLTEFLRAVKNADEGNENTFDIKHLMTSSQRIQFDKLESVVADLFGAENLYAGIEKTVKDTELTNTQQVSVLVFLKIFETFIQTVSELGENMPTTPNETYTSIMNDEVERGMYG